jgi:hypothetical protein
MNKCSREDSNLHGFPHTVLSRTRLPVPPREPERREAIGEMPDVKKIERRKKEERTEGTERIVLGAFVVNNPLSALLSLCVLS